MTRPILSRGRSRAFARRRLLTGAGGITIGLPFLEAVAPRGARAQAAPRRFVVFNHPEGVIASHWQPPEGADRTGFSLAPGMEALAPYKGDLIITRGVDSLSCKDVGSTHKSSMDHILTGGAGTSIDQVIAQKVGKDYRFASLELGVSVRAMVPGYRAVWSGGKVVPCLNEPRDVFARMFAGGTAPVAAGGTFTVDQTAILQLAAKRRSVIDAVKAQFDAIKMDVSGEDRARLEAHLGAIREAEKELLGAGAAPAGPAPAAPAGAALDCKSPKLDAPAVVDQAVRTRQQMDLLVLALACRLTPVVTLQWSQTGCPETFSFLKHSTTDVYHGWVHNDKRNPDYTEQWRQCLKWFGEQFAYLLGRMKQVNEGGRTLLDSSAVVMVSSFGHAGGHSPVNVPFVIAGSAGGVFKTGQYLDYTTNRQPHNRVLLALAKAFGVDMNAYGNAKYGTTPLPELFA
jgi:hypothetical protein